MKKILSLVLLAVMFVSFANVSLAATDVEKSHLTFGTTGEPTDLSPYGYYAGATWRIKAQIYSKLCEFNPYGDLVWDIVESYTQQDALNYEFKIYDNILYSDGDKLTAKDVIWSLAGHLTLPGAADLALIINIEKCYAIDDYNFHITLNKTSPLLFSMLTFMYIGNEEDYNASSDKMATTPIGSGPYQLVSYDYGSRLELVENPYYFRGGSTIKSITFKIISDTSQRANELEAGTVDAICQTAASDYGYLTGLDGISGYAVPMYNTYALAYNCKPGSLLCDKTVRQALSYAIDTYALNQAAFKGYNTPVRCTLGENYLDFDPVMTEKGYYEYDKDKALQLLDDAGVKPGTPIRIVTEDKTTYRANAEIVQAFLIDVGLDATITLYDEASIHTVLEGDGYEWEIYVCDNAVSSALSLELYAYLYLDEGNRHVHWQENDDFTELYNEALKISSVEERQPIINEMNAILVENVPAYHLTTNTSLFTHKSYIENFCAFDVNIPRMWYWYQDVENFNWNYAK